MTANKAVFSPKARLSPSIDALIKEARNVSLLDVVGNDVSLKQRGKEHWGLCPFHKEKTPSFSVNPTKGVYGCLGCGEGGDVIKYAMWRQGLPFINALYYLTDADRPRPAHPLPAATATDSDADKKQKCEEALTIWRESIPALGTPAETYLRSRGITILPPSLKFHPDLKHDFSPIRFPAMVAAVQGPDNKVTGVHRTYLLSDGSGKAKVEKQKLARGVVARGSVRLADVAPKIGIAEGIETGLSVQQATGLPVWATVGTSGMGNVILPKEIREVVVCADPGEAGERAAVNAARRFIEEGRTAKVARPSGKGDFNDALLRTCK